MPIAGSPLATWPCLRQGAKPEFLVLASQQTNRDRFKGEEPVATIRGRCDAELRILRCRLQAIALRSCHFCTARSSKTVALKAHRPPREKPNVGDEECAVRTVGKSFHSDLPGGAHLTVPQARLKFSPEMSTPICVTDFW